MLFFGNLIKVRLLRGSGGSSKGHENSWAFSFEREGRDENTQSSQMPSVIVVAKFRNPLETFRVPLHSLHMQHEVISTLFQRFLLKKLYSSSQFKQISFSIKGGG